MNNILCFVSWNNALESILTDYHKNVSEFIIESWLESKKDKLLEGVFV